MLPARKNGILVNALFARRGPVNKGESDAPIVLATPVTPAAAERSSGATTAIV